MWAFDVTNTINFPSYLVMKDNAIKFYSLNKGLMFTTLNHPVKIPDIADNPRLTGGEGKVVPVEGKRMLASFPNVKNVELLHDPSVENADFEAGITSWQNRFSGYCEARQLLLEDGEGSPHTGEVFAKIAKESNSSQSVFSDTSPMQMALGDKYRFSVYGRTNGLKARLAIWASDGDGVQKAIVIENSWTQYSVEYTAGSKMAGKMCAVCVEIYFDGGVHPL